MPSSCDVQPGGMRTGLCLTHTTKSSSSANLSLTLTNLTSQLTHLNQRILALTLTLVPLTLVPLS